jgi:hypothetical protein
MSERASEAGATAALDRLPDEIEKAIDAYGLDAFDHGDAVGRGSWRSVVQSERDAKMASRAALVQAIRAALSGRAASEPVAWMVESQHGVAFWQRHRPTISKHQSDEIAANTKAAKVRVVPLGIIVAPADGREGER